jgi:hypothetical protein
MKKLYSALGSILGFLIIILYAFKNSQALFGYTFEGDTQILGYFDLVQQYLVYALAGLTGLELVAGKRIIAFIFFILLAFVVISTFFPGVIETYVPTV